MKYLNKIAALACFFALGLTALTSCEGGDLYSVGAPDWISDKVDSIRNAKSGESGPLYTFGKTDYTSGWWQDFSRYYVIPAGEVWESTFDLHIAPGDQVYYHNFALIITNDVERGGAGYAEYGAIRFDNAGPTSLDWNSEWGTYIDRSLIEGNLVLAPSGDPASDPKVQQLAGTVTLTVDRTSDGIAIRMDNGTVWKTYTQTAPLENLNADKSNTDIRCFIVVEGTYIDFLSSNIEPFDENADRQPLSMSLTVPSEVLLGTGLDEFMESVQATVAFEGGKTINVSGKELTFEVQPDLSTIGTKTLFAAYNKTLKGHNGNAVLATKTFNVVKEISAFTETVVVPTPLALGADDNSTPFWGAHTENIKIEPKETKVVSFTNYTSGGANWNNFCIVLCKDNNAEYAVVRADNFGWGDGYAACTPVMEEGRVWEEWLPAMNGAKVTAYITNNGDGTANIKAVMVGNDGKTYTQDYLGINTIDPDNFYFRFTVDGCHLVFDSVIGAEDNSTPFWGAHSANVRVIAKQICTATFTNYTSGVANWNNFCIVLCKENNEEYAVVRADNFGWGNGYAACTPSGGQADWGAWLAAMNGAKVTVKVVNNGDGTADVKAIMHGKDGVDYVQDYIGINTIDPDNFFFRFTVDGSHIVLE